MRAREAIEAGELKATATERAYMNGAIDALEALLTSIPKIGNDLFGFTELAELVAGCCRVDGVEGELKYFGVVHAGSSREGRIDGGVSEGFDDLCEDVFDGVVDEGFSDPRRSAVPAWRVTTSRRWGPSIRW